MMRTRLGDKNNENLNKLIKQRKCIVIIDSWKYLRVEPMKPVILHAHLIKLVIYKTH